MRRTPWKCWVAAIGAIAPLAGCSPRGVDEQVRQLLADSARRTGGEALTPDWQGSPGPTPIPRDATSMTPPTTNPSARDLRYQPAEESRDIRGRLADLAQRAEGAPALALRDALATAQDGGREFRAAEEEYILAAIRLLVERHRWSPRLFNDTSVSLAGAGDDGDFQHALDVINTLRVTQQLPTGGSLEARWVVNATEQLRERASRGYVQASSLVLSGSIPLLRGAGDVAREDLIQQERNLVYAARTFESFRRRLLVGVANDFFRLKQLEATIVNAQRQLEALRLVERSTASRVEAGRLDAFQTSIASSRVLAAEASLAGLREQLILELDRFKIRLGLGPQDQVALGEIGLDLPDPGVDLGEATDLALRLRLDLQNQRDRLDDARRALGVARDALLPDLTLDASAQLPTDPRRDRGNLSPSPGDASYSVGATLSLPLDREIERLRVREAMVSLARQEREYEEARDTVVVRVRSALRAVDVARFQLRLAEEQVKINQRRLEEQQLKADSFDTQRLVDSLNELLDAENNRDRARTELRTAILNYLLESDQLRVDRDGNLAPLPGMEARSDAVPPAE